MPNPSGEAEEEDMRARTTDQTRLDEKIKEEAGPLTHHRKGSVIARRGPTYVEFLATNRVAGHCETRTSCELGVFGNAPKCRSLRDSNEFYCFGVSSNDMCSGKRE